MKRKYISLVAMALLLSACGTDGSRSFQTDYFRIDIDAKGYIVGMWNQTKESRNFSPVDSNVIIIRRRHIIVMEGIDWNMKTVRWLLSVWMRKINTLNLNWKVWNLVMGLMESNGEIIIRI